MDKKAESVLCLFLLENCFWSYCKFCSLKKFLSEENLKPTETWRNPVWRHHGEWWETDYRDMGIFGPMETIEQQIGRSQYMQAGGALRS